MVGPAYTLGAEMRLIYQTPQRVRLQFTAQYRVKGESRTQTFVYELEGERVPVTPSDIVRRVAEMEEEFELQFIDVSVVAARRDRFVSK